MTDVERVRELAKGFPAEEEELLTRLADRAEELEGVIESIEAEVAKVYCHITNGRISNCNTLASAVIAESDDITTDMIYEVEKERDALKAKIARAEALHFKMCRASLDAEGMAVSERAIKAIWDREVDIMEMDK